MALGGLVILSQLAPPVPEPIVTESPADVAATDAAAEKAAADKAAAAKAISDKTGAKAKKTEETRESWKNFP